MSFIAPPHLQAPPDDQHRPMRVRLTTSLSQSNYQGGDQGLVQVLADTILQQRSAEITGWVNMLRQQTSINPLGYISRDLNFIDCSVNYTRSQNDEVLEITVYPNPPSSTTEGTPSGNQFDVACPFQGYPVGSKLEQSIYSWAGWNLYKDDTMTADDDTHIIPLPWTLKIGKTGTCIAPISGQQYWECEIITLPASAPRDFVTNFPTAVFDGSFVDCDVVDVNKIKLTNKFPTRLDTWLTPAIGLIPKQLVPNGLVANTVTDDMLVGLDTDDTFNVARTVYVVPTVVDYTDVQTKNWDAPQYWIISPSDVDTKPVIGSISKLTLSVGPPPDVTNLIGHSPGPALEVRYDLQCQVLEADWNPVYIANVPVKPTITIGGGFIGSSEIPPVVRGDAAGIGVGGKYMLIPTVTLNQMPIDAFTVDDILPALAAQKATNTAGINATIALDAAAGTIDTYNTITIAADPRRTGFAIPGATPYLFGTSKTFQMVSEVGVTDDTPIPIDDNLFINGSFQMVPLIIGALGYQAGMFVETDYTKSYVIGDYLNGPGANFPANSDSLDLLLFDSDDDIAFLYEVNASKTPPQGVNAIGSHTWGFKGRGDTLASTTTATDDGPLDPPLGGEGALFNGVWSGVDLGTLEIDDVLMFATDVSARKLWLGKNGKWYDTHGPTDFTPGQPELGAALLLDGEPSQDYFPAATLRVGPSHVRFLFGEETHFAAPGGFDFYGV